MFKLKMFIVICVLFASKVMATSLHDIEQIAKLENNEAKLAAYKAVDQTIFTNQQAANEYFTAYAKFLSNNGEFDQAIKILEQEIASPTVQYNDRYTARLYKNLGDILYDRNDYQAAKELVETSLIYYKRAKNIELITSAMMKLGSIELRTGNYLKGLQLAQTYRKEYESVLTQESLADIYSFLGRAYDHLGEFQTALEHKLKTLEIEQAIGIVERKQADTLYSIAHSLQKIGRYQAAYERFYQTLIIDKKSGNRQDIGHSLTNLSYVAYKLDKLDLSIAHAKEATENFKVLKHERHQAWAKHNMALSYAAKGEKLTALQLEQNNQRLLSSIKGDHHLKTSVWNHLAKLYLEQGQPNLAIEQAKTALAFGNSSALADRRTMSLEIIHKAYNALNNHEKAYEYQGKLLALQNEQHESNLAKRLAYLQNTIEFKENAHKLAEKEQENQIINNELALQKQRQAVAALVLAVFLSFALIVFIRTKQKRQLEQQQQKHLNKMLEQRNQLFSQIAHDLSNPVTVASLHIEAMQHQVVECKPDNLTKISDKLKDLNHLVSDLAGLAKLETAHFTLNTQKVALPKFIDDIQDEIHAQPTEQAVKVCTAKLNAEVANIDAVRIKQVIANLFSNAKKYTHSIGEIQLYFGTSNTHLNITIQDSPPTVPQEYLNSIFDHLFRVPNMSNTETPGHGIGLSIVRQIVQLHNGTITASQSELGGVKN